MPRAAVLATALFLLPVVLPLVAEPAAAARISPMGDLPVAMLGASAVWTGDAVYLFGGRGAGNTYRSDILRYDVATGTAEKVADLPPSSLGPAARQSTAAVWSGSKAYIFGGAVVVGGVPRSVQDIVEFDPRTNTALNVQAGSCVPSACVDGLPEPLFGMAAAWVSGKAYLFGGLKFIIAGAASNFTWQDRIYVFDPAAPVGQDKVTLLDVRLPYRAQDMAPVVYDDDVYLIGGFAQVAEPDGTEDVCPRSTIVRFSPATQRARLEPVNLPRRLHFHAAAVLDQTVYVFGGREEREACSSNYVVTSEAIIQWRPGSAPREHPITLPLPRYAASVVGTPSGVVIAGGRDSGDHADGMASVLVFSGARGPPTAPTEVRVSQGLAVNVTWRAPIYDGDAGLDGFRVERIDADGSLRPVARLGADARSATDPGAPGSGQVTYRVVAFNVQGDGPAAAVRVTLGPRPPDAPEGIGVYAGNAEVALRWTSPASTGGSAVVEYLVERSDANGSELFRTTASNYTDTNVTNHVAYSYRVSARNAIGVGSPTPAVEATPVPVPGRPAGVTVEDSGAEVAIAWGAVAGADSYEVLRGTSPVDLAVLARVTAPGHVDSDLAEGARYWYAVRAVNTFGGGIPSEPVPVERLAPPGPPRGLSAIAGIDFVRLQWLAPNSTGGVPAGDVRYLVERQRAGDSRAVVIVNDLAATAYTDRSVDPETEYVYSVTAVSRAGRGAPSDGITVTVGTEDNELPVAALSAKPAGTLPGSEVTLDASFSTDPDGVVAEYDFDFGDGTVTGWQLNPTVTHAYKANGVYTASVSVRDERGGESAKDALAQVVIGPPRREKTGGDTPDPTIPVVDDNDTPPPTADDPRPGVPAPGLVAAVVAVAFAAAAWRRRG